MKTKTVKIKKGKDMEKEMIHITDDLRKAVADIKSAILSTQYRLAGSANGELLSRYYGIGQYISDNTRNKAWALER